MPQPNLGPPDIQVGGYIPYIDLPCERYIGESSGWLTFLFTTGPLTCKYIPWLCCPLPFDFNNTVAVSSDIRCEEIGAIYGATLFWTMQAIAIWGFFLAMAHLAQCTIEIGLGIQEAPEPLETILNAINPLAGDEGDENATLTIEDFLSIKPMTLEVIKKLNNTVGGALPSLGGREEDNEILSQIMDEDILGMDNVTEARARRTKRQSGFLGLSIPTLEPLYTGPDESSDVCDRDEILHVDGECHQILSQGPCEDTELVLMDPQTKKGYCAPRLCNPDRVFVFGDQRCHDPYENDICPPGRILFTSSYGSPVCGCPYGTYEEEEDLDEDVCQPVLGKLESCGPGEVYWFTSFRREPECLPDPCKGINAKKGLNELPYVPSIFDGKCYQLGQELPQCPDDTYYTLSYSSLKGICASLEFAGYTVLDEDMLETFAALYGSRLPRDIASAFAAFKSSSSSSSNKGFRIPDIGDSAVAIPSFDPKSNLLPLKIGQSVMSHRSSSSDSEDSDSDSSSSSSSSSSSFSSKRSKDSSALDVQVLPTHATAFSPSSLSFNSKSPLASLFQHFSAKRNESVEESDENEIGKSRSRRDTLAHASPETVFQSSLASCRAGGRMGLNFKCNTKYLPNRLPLSRPKRNIAPIEPFPKCPKGSLYSITRKCVSNSDKARTSLIAHGLG